MFDAKTRRKLACFGDSITGPEPGLNYRHQYLKWGDHLQTLLTNAGEDTEWSVLNYGKAGDTSSGLRSRIGNHLRESRPDFAVVLIGGNNFGNDADPEKAAAQLEEDLTAIVCSLREGQVRVILLQYYEPKAENLACVWRHLNLGNSTVARVAANEDIPILNLAPDFSAASEKFQLDQLLNPVDGVHLNPEGEKVLAKAVLNRMKELGWVS